MPPENAAASSIDLVPRPTGLRWWLMVTGVFALATFVMCFELGDFRSMGSHEVFAAVPAREMLQSGDWIVPRFGGMLRLKKPPLSFWVVAASGRLFGEFNEWTVRVPAAVSALLLAALMGVWAHRRYGWEAGLGAALVQSTSVFAVIHGRKAEVDMLLCLLMTFALFLVIDQRESESRRASFARWVAIYLAIGLAWMAKFHFGPVLVLTPVVLFFVIQRRFRSFVRMANPVGLAVFAAALFVWPYLVLQQVPDAMQIWRRETVGRASGELGFDPVWFFIPHILCFALPWTWFALRAIPASWRRAWRDGDEHERFLWIWFIAQLAIVSTSATKHKHYIVPAMPMLSLLCGQTFRDLARRVRAGQPLLGPRLAIAITLTASAGAIGGWLTMNAKWPALSIPALAVCASAAVGVSAVAWMIALKRLRAATVCAVLTFVICYAGAVGWIVPGRDHRMAAARFARTVRAELLPDQEICVFGMGKVPVVFYLDDPVFRLEDVNALSARLNRDKRMFVISQQTAIDKIERIGKTRVIEELGSPPDLAPHKGPRLLLLEVTVDNPAPSDASQVGAAESSGGPSRR